MANQNDSFIDEVTQELRRDRLAQAMRRYGWVVLALIVLLVAFAGWQEFSQKRATSDAEAYGDALLAAEGQPDPAKALGEVASGGSPGRDGLSGLLQADAQLAAGDRPGAIATLDRVAGEGATPAPLRDLARLKSLALQDGMDPAQRIAALDALTAPGAPYRLLATEQKAGALIDAGRRDEAVALIRQLQQEQGLTDNLSRRLGEKLVTLGVEAEPARPGAPGDVTVVGGATPAAAPAMPAPAN